MRSAPGGAVTAPPDAAGLALLPVYAEAGPISLAALQTAARQASSAVCFARAEPPSADGKPRAGLTAAIVGADGAVLARLDGCDDGQAVADLEIPPADPVPLWRKRNTLSNFLWFIMATLVLVLLFSATITITLRRYSRSRTQRLLQQRGREAWMKRLVSTQNELAQCMAVLRTSCTALLVLAIFHGLAALELDSLRTRYGVAFVATLTLFVTFGVAIPSAWAKYAGEPFLVFSLPLLWGLHTLMYPLLLIARIFDGLVRRLAGAPEEDSEEVTARHEQELLDAVSEGEIVGAVNEDEREMIESVMELRDSDVEEIMTPRTEIRAVPTDCTLAELKDLIGKIGHSRIPIFEETIDNIVGIIYAKDLLHVGRYRRVRRPRHHARSPLRTRNQESQRTAQRVSHPQGPHGHRAR
jgi:CBS domain-containing protein